MTGPAALALYSVLIVAASVAGGLVPILVRLTHRRLQLATSAIAGFMLGVALLHLLPHALMAIDPMTAAAWLTGGVLLMFFLERAFSYHQHDVVADDADEAEPHAHDHQGHGHAHPPTSRLSWPGVAAGLVLHSLIGGAALAAAIRVEAGGGSPWPGLAVFLVIVLHKPLDSMTLLTLMTRHGWSTRARHAINALFSLSVPLGAAVALVGLRAVDPHDPVVGIAVAVAAGVFLCVALSDLLPELHFHTHDRVALSVALLLGLGLAAGVSYFERSSHAHAEHHAEPADVHDTDPDHDDHDHDHHDHGH